MLLKLSRTTGHSCIVCQQAPAEVSLAEQWAQSGMRAKVEVVPTAELKKELFAAKAEGMSFYVRDGEGDRLGTITPVTWEWLLQQAEEPSKFEKVNAVAMLAMSGG